MQFQVSAPMAVTHIPFRARKPRVDLFTTPHVIDVIEMKEREAPISAVIHYKKGHVAFRFAGGSHYSPVAPVSWFGKPEKSRLLPTMSGLNHALARHMALAEGSTRAWRELAELEPATFQMRQSWDIPNPTKQRQFNAIRDLKELEEISVVQHEGLGSLERDFIAEFSEGFMVCEGWLWSRCPEPLIWAEHGKSGIEATSLINTGVFEVSHLMAKAAKPMGAEKLGTIHPYFDSRWSSFHSILEWSSIKETSKGQGRRGKKVIRNIEILMPEVFDEPVIEREVERFCVNVLLWTTTMWKRQRLGKDIWLASVPANIQAAGNRLEQYRDLSTSEQMSTLEDFSSALSGDRAELSYKAIAAQITKLGQRFDASDIAPDISAAAFVPCR